MQFAESWRKKKTTLEERVAKAEELGGEGAYVWMNEKKLTLFKIHKVMNSGWVQLESVKKNGSLTGVSGTLINPLNLTKAQAPEDETAG